MTMQLIQTGGEAGAYFSAFGPCRGTPEGFFAAVCYRPNAAGGANIFSCTGGSGNGWQLQHSINGATSSVLLQLALYRAAGTFYGATITTMQKARGRIIHACVGAMQQGGNLQTFLVVNGAVLVQGITASAGGMAPSLGAFVLGSPTSADRMDFLGAGYADIGQFGGDYNAAVRAAVVISEAVVQTGDMFEALLLDQPAVVEWENSWDSASLLSLGPLSRGANGRPLGSSTWQARAGGVSLLGNEGFQGPIITTRQPLWLQPVE